jgi:hypothetical protein
MTTAARSRSPSGERIAFLGSGQKLELRKGFAEALRKARGRAVSAS